MENATTVNLGLGEHPFKGMVKFSSFLAVVGSAATALLFWIDPVLGSLLGCAVLIFAGFLALSMIGFLIGGSGGWKYYRQAKKLILNGNIEPTYIGKNGNWSTLMIVDEKNGKIFLNGDIHNFDAIRSIQRKSSNNIYVTLKTGETPVDNIRLDSEREVVMFYQRLMNTLQFV
ncbi:MAG: hypothetical protein ACYDAI_02520 [Trichloromonadaceae bacterium]